MKKLGLLIWVGLFTFTCLAQNYQLDGPDKEKNDNNQSVKNIILLIGDGMGVTQIYAALTVNNGKLNLEKCKNIGFSKTYAADDFITDSGAAGTALAIGHKTYNNAIGVDIDKKPHISILEYAEKNGKATGLIATSTITHATPASFIAHQPSRNNYEEIAADFLKTDIEVFIGGGLHHFNHRKDGKDLTKILIERGYSVVYNLDDLKVVNNTKLAGLLYDASPPKRSEGRGDMLPVSSAKAIEILNQNSSGFFLMIEGSQIDWGGHDNDSEYLIDELLDFDNTIGEVLKFAEADGNTLVIITADHETGGFSLGDGDIKKGKVKGSFSTDHHTGVMVPVFAYGPGSENFRGIYENTDIFFKMMQAFGFEEIK